MMGEILLVVDGQVQDSATYKNDKEKNRLSQQFLAVKDMIVREHPYSEVSVDYREIKQ